MKRERPDESRGYADTFLLISASVPGTWVAVSETPVSLLGKMFVVTFASTSRAPQHHRHIHLHKN